MSESLADPAVCMSLSLANPAACMSPHTIRCYFELSDSWGRGRAPPRFQRPRSRGAMAADMDLGALLASLVAVARDGGHHAAEQRVTDDTSPTSLLDGFAKQFPVEKAEAPKAAPTTCSQTSWDALAQAMDAACEKDATISAERRRRSRSRSLMHGRNIPFKQPPAPAPPSPCNPPADAQAAG